MKLLLCPSEIFRDSRRLNHKSCKSHGEHGNPPPPLNARLRRTATGMSRPHMKQYDGGGLEIVLASQSCCALEASFAIP